MHEILDLSGRVAIVTGAASGYGRATALVLAKFGGRVVLCDVNERELNKVADAMPARENHLVDVRDISSVSQCEALVTSALTRYGRLDILVNVAAILQRVDIEDVDEAHWQRTLDVNLKSYYFLSRAAARPMKRAKWGRIINFISTAGITGGSPPTSVYGISKGGVIAMTKSFARNFGRDNILVNAISPASLRTPLFRGGLSDEDFERMSAKYLESCLFGRWTDAEEVAMSVLFLASDMSSCVTGHVLRADSGAEVMHP